MPRIRPSAVPSNEPDGAASSSPARSDRHRLGQAEVEHLRAHVAGAQIGVPCSTMLAGFRSRWTIPFSCAASSASAICRAMASASAIGSGPRSSRSASVGPSTSSRTSARHAVALFEAVDGADVRMIQRGERARFAREPGAALGIGREVRRQDLDRDVATELACRGRDRPRPSRRRRAARRSCRGRADVPPSTCPAAAPSRAPAITAAGDSRNPDDCGLVLQERLDFLAAAPRLRHTHFSGTLRARPGFRASAA